MSLTIEELITKWQGSAGDERANFHSFLSQFCEASRRTFTMPDLPRWNRPSAAAG